MENTRKNKQPNAFTRFLKEWGIFLTIITLAILSRIFIWSLVVVDGHSMDPTLADKQRLVLIKTASINRFDIVVAKETESINGQTETKDVVKRVIGMPGDEIKFDNDQLYINGQKTDEPYLADFKKQLSDGELEKTYQNYALTSELSEANRAYFVQLAQQSQAFTTDTTGNPTFSIKVPEGEYLLLGDNRIVSRDSRAVGTFKRSEIVGRTVFRIWPLNKISTLN
ncbi:signal peptidase I [Lactococcus muris]|uniref:Signal peptidase I n=1 Tax=Lactococcus muris TaxID=2941330 RepID=A0ABV4DB75_9LACT|nr:MULTISPECIES: signal peptidase I [Lactococcus]MBL3717065.1 signal peptidase I [Lactococcus garvieae]HAP15830.1 signal peptidase I [Lactococcus sp.]